MKHLQSTLPEDPGELISVLNSDLKTSCKKLVRLKARIESHQKKIDKWQKGHPDRNIQDDSSEDAKSLKKTRNFLNKQIKDLNEKIVLQALQAVQVEAEGAALKMEMKK